MLRADYEKVYIEHCISCKSHAWCTNHDESKYVSYFTTCKNAIMRACSNITVLENEVPVGFANKFITDPNATSPGKYHFPRIGSFEVYFRGKVVFSKIESVKWPLPSSIANKIYEIQNTITEKSKGKGTKGRRLKSANVTRKRKSKKGKKKAMKIKNQEFNENKFQDKNTNKDIYFRNDSSVYQQDEIPNFSVDISQHSDNEQPVPPYDYYKTKPQALQLELPQKKSATPAQYIEKEKSKEVFKNHPSDKFEDFKVLQSESANKFISSEDYFSSSEENFKNQLIDKPKSPVSYQTSQVLDLKPQDLEKSENPENFEKPEKVEKPEKFEKPEKSEKPEKFEKPEKSEKPEKFEKPEKSEKPEESEKLENFEKLEKLEKSKNFENLEKPEESEKSEDYEESENYDEEQFQESSSEYTEEKYEKNSENTEKNNQSSPEDNKSEEYEDSEFEEDYQEPENIHPKRNVDKSFTVKLPLASESKKKITYQNDSDSDAVFVVESSNPDFMSIKEPQINIEKGKKGKIQLRFEPVYNDEEKKYYLYVDRNGEPWECIEIIAEYEE
jgi:hypothetical protein